MSEEDTANDESGKTTSSNPPSPAPKIINGVEAAKPATEEQLKDVERGLNAFERSTLKWTRTSAGIYAITAFFIWLQWREMRSGSADTHALAVAAGKQADQAKAQVDKMSESLGKTDDLIKQARDQAAATNRLAQQAGRSADIANSILKDNQRAFEVSTRPYVTIYNARLLRPISAGQTFQIQAQLRNSGRTPAFHIHARVETMLHESKNALSFWPPGTDLSAPIDIPSDVDRPITFFGQYPMPVEVIKSITDRTHVLYFYGEFWYSSLSIQYEPVKFCFRYDVGDDPVGLAACEIETYDAKTKPQHVF